MKHPIRRLLRQLEAQSEKSWYLPLVAFLSGVDAYILIVPNEALLIPAVIARRRHWKRVAFFVALGSAVGATSFAALASWYGEAFINAILPNVIASPEWQSASEWIQSKGALGLALVSASPFPQHIAVAVVGLAHLSLLHVFIAILVGRGIKYGILSWGILRVPGFFLRKKMAADSQPGKAEPVE